MLKTHRRTTVLRDGAPKPKADRVEDRLQTDIVSYFRAAIAPSPLAPMLLAIANGEGRSKSTAGRLVGISGEQRAHLPDDQALMPFGLGVLPGAVDLALLLSAGRTVWIEIKRPADKLRGRKAGTMSRMQRLFAQRLGNLYHHHVVVQSMDEFAALLMGQGIKLRVRFWGPEVVKPGEPPRLPTGKDVNPQA